MSFGGHFVYDCLSFPLCNIVKWVPSKKRFLLMLFTLITRQESKLHNDYKRHIKHGKAPVLQRVTIDLGKSPNQSQISSLLSLMYIVAIDINSL